MCTNGKYFIKPFNSSFILLVTTNDKVLDDMSNNKGTCVLMTIVLLSSRGALLLDIGPIEEKCKIISELGI